MPGKAEASLKWDASMSRHDTTTINILMTLCDIGRIHRSLLSGVRSTFRVLLWSICVLRILYFAAKVFVRRLHTAHIQYVSCPFLPYNFVKLVSRSFFLRHQREKHVSNIVAHGIFESIECYRDKYYRTRDTMISAGIKTVSAKLRATTINHATSSRFLSSKKVWNVYLSGEANWQIVVYSTIPCLYYKKHSSNILT